MSVPRRKTEAVFQHDQVAIVAGVRGRFNRSVRRGEYRASFFCRDVETLMKARLSGERIAAATERAGEPAMRRPDGRSCGGQRLATLDVAAHAAQTAFEAMQHITQHAQCLLRCR